MLLRRPYIREVRVAWIIQVSLIKFTIEKSCLMITVRRGACISETYNSSLAFGTLYFLRILQ